MARHFSPHLYIIIIPPCSHSVIAVKWFIIICQNIDVSLSVSALFSEQSLYLAVVWVEGAEDVRQLGLQPGPQLLRDEGLGGLGGVQAVRGLDQVSNVPTLVRPSVQHSPERIVQIMQVEPIKLLLPGQLLQLPAASVPSAVGKQNVNEKNSSKL